MHCFFLIFTGDLNGAQFEALVDKYHSLYVAQLKQLFADNKEKYAKEAGDLQLVE